MKTGIIATAILFLLIACGSQKKEYGPEDEINLDPHSLNAKAFKQSWKETFGEARDKFFFVKENIYDPERVVVRRNDGVFFSALNLKSRKFKYGQYVKLTQVTYYRGISAEDSYLEIESILGSR